MKKLSPFILVGLIALVVYFTLSSQNEYREIREKGTYDTCSVRTRGEDVICTFNIEDKDLTRTLSKPYATMRTGEQFRVYYYDEIPDKYYVAFEEPVIIESQFNSTNTIEVNDDGSHIKFSYSVEGREVSRFQEIPEGVEVEEGKSYTVMYKVSDFRIGYVVF